MKTLTLLIITFLMSGDLTGLCLYIQSFTFDFYHHIGYEETGKELK